MRIIPQDQTTQTLVEKKDCYCVGNTCSCKGTVAATTATSAVQHSSKSDARAKTAVATKGARRTAAVATRQHVVKQRRGSLLSWLPLLLIPVLGWLGYTLFKRNRTTGYQKETAYSKGSVRQVETKTAGREEASFRQTNREPSTEKVVSSSTNLVANKESNNELRIADTACCSDSSCNTTVNRSTPRATVSGEFPVTPCQTEDREYNISNHEDLEVSSNSEYNEIRTTNLEQAQLSTTNDVTGSQVVTESQQVVADSQVVDQSQRQDLQQTSAQGERFDWTEVEGVDATTRDALYQRGYVRFEDLAQLEPENLRSELGACGLNLDGAGCQQWIQQAAQFSPVVSANSLVQNTGNRIQTASIPNVVTEQSSSIQTLNVGGSTISSSSQNDDLTKINGIGPATSSLLNASGICSFQDLRNASLGQLQQILNQGGESFKAIDPVSWFAQANHALQGNWQALELWDSSQTTSTQTECKMASVSQSNTKDDLTQIKGIGPATQKRLNAKGVHSLVQIANMDVQQIAGILEGLDGQFNLVDPETWQTQARELLGAGWNTATDIESSIVSEINELADETVDLATNPYAGKTFQTRNI